MSNKYLPLIYGVAGEVCKYLSFNDIVEALAAGIFEKNNIDVQHHLKKTKARLLAVMCKNSSFHYDNKNITDEQLKTLLYEHCMILKKHILTYNKTTLTTRTVQFNMEEINDNIKQLKLKVEESKNRKETYIQTHLFIDNPLLHVILFKRHHKDVYAVLVKHRYPKCRYQHIAVQNCFAKRKYHSDIRDLKSFVVPKYIKQLKK